MLLNKSTEEMNKNTSMQHIPIKSQLSQILESAPEDNENDNVTNINQINEWIDPVWRKR